MLKEIHERWLGHHYRLFFDGLDSQSLFAKRLGNNLVQPVFVCRCGQDWFPGFTRRSLTRRDTFARYRL